MAYHKGIPGIGAVTAVPSGSNPTAIDIALVTDISVSHKSEDVDLVGSDLDPIDSFEASRSITGKVSLNEFSAELVSATTAGVTVSDGTQFAATETFVVSSTTKALTVPAGGTIVEVLAVVNLTNGIRMKRVASAPATNEFSVSAGTLTLAAADNGDTLFVRAKWSATTGRQALVKQATLGTATPKFGLNYFADQGGKRVGIYYPACRIYNLENSFKRGAWASGSFDFKALPDASGNLEYIWAAE